MSNTMFLFGFFPDDNNYGDPCYFGIFSSHEAGVEYLEKFRTIGHYSVSRSLMGENISFNVFAESERELLCNYPGATYTKIGNAYRMEHREIYRDFSSYFVEEVPFLG